MFPIYNLTIHSVFVLLFPYFLFRLLTEKKHRIGLGQRLGFVPRGVVKGRRGEPVIWVHSVSVGEVLAASPLVAEIRRRFPGRQLLLSTTTVTGHEVCLKKVAGEGDLVIYFPVDVPFAVRRVMALFSPRVIILMETEIWPNLIGEARRRGIELLLVNGRLSNKSFDRYRMVRTFVGPLLRSFSFIGMQTEEGAERMRELGAPSEVVRVMGSMKYEAALSSMPREAEVETLRKELGIPERRVIVAGSTHRGEEQLVVRAWMELREKYPDLFVVVAPRHPERFREVENRLRQAGIRYRRRTAGLGAGSPCGVMVLDTLGELTKFYGMASLAFVGKSLTRKGGQNPLEPAACGKPVIFGRHMENFREVADLLLAEGGAMEVGSFRELVAAFDSLLADEAAAREMGGRARNTVESRTGGVALAVGELRKVLARGRVRPRRDRAVGDNLL
jgi:3-deoxy-D-manno-octulosonic-acid transferase